jgi:DNA-binding transcriptional LysR family regulator
MRVTASPLFRDHVHVGASQDFVEYVLPFACSARYQADARLRVAMMVAPEEITLPALAQGQIDLVITHRSEPAAHTLAQETLYDDHMFVVCAHDHPLAENAELSLSDLIGQQWALPSMGIYRQLSQMFSKRGLPDPELGIVAGSSSLRLARVARSRMLGMHSLPTLLALTEARAHVAILCMKDLFWRRSVVAVHRGGEWLSEASRRFVDDVRAFGLTPLENP